MADPFGKRIFSMEELRLMLILRRQDGSSVHCVVKLVGELVMFSPVGFA